MIKIIDQIDTFPIVQEFNSLESGISWLTHREKKYQTGLQHLLGEDPWTSAVGKSRGNDAKIDQLNPFFKNTIFETLINKYNLKRTRLLYVNPKECYSMHQDFTPRIHIPLITNKDCYFVFRDHGIHHFSLGNVYWVDTRHHHTFMNCSDEQRLHLVGVVEN
jgi:hypothetical protein